MNILVVDDAVIYRMALTRILENEPWVSSVKSLSNGELAINYLKNNNNIDLVILDLEMPVSDGIKTTEAIRKMNSSIPIIVFSSTCVRGAEKAVAAFRAGADDVIAKESVTKASSLAGNMEMISEILIPKVKAFMKQCDEINSPVIQPSDNKKVNSITPQLVCIGASTGGPRALAKIFGNLKRRINVPVLIAQHMPPIFTYKIAEELDTLTNHITVVEALEGEIISPGICYIAPGGCNMFIDNKKRISLERVEEKIPTGPSVDMLFKSIYENLPVRVLALILTGMGSDGSLWATQLRNRGDYVYVQDKDSSTVWGMPAAVKKIDNRVGEVSLEDIPELLEYHLEAA